MALTDKLSAIGDAIREKTGTTATLTLTEMPDAIRGIETGTDFGDLEVLSGTFTPATTTSTFVFSEHIGYQTFNAIVGCYFYGGIYNNGGGIKVPTGNNNGFHGIVSSNNFGECWSLASDKKSVSPSIDNWFQQGVEYTYILIRPKGLYVPNYPEVISDFTIEPYAYEFDDGMCWRDWVSSDFGPDGSYGYTLYDDGTYIRWNNPNYQYVIAHSDGTPVLQTERIMAGEAYKHVINEEVA